MIRAYREYGRHLSCLCYTEAGFSKSPGLRVLPVRVRPRRSWASWADEEPVFLMFPQISKGHPALQTADCWPRSVYSGLFDLPDAPT